MEELRRTLALLFRRKGKEVLTEKEFILSASMDLRWFPPRDAQRLLQAAVQAGLLKAEGGQVRPAFDVAAVEIPLDFQPTAEVFKVKPATRDLFLEILDRLEASTKRDRKALVAEVNEVQASLGVRAEVAALVVGRATGVDMSAYYAAVEELLLTHESGPGRPG